MCCCWKINNKSYKSYKINLPIINYFSITACTVMFYSLHIILLLMLLQKHPCVLEQLL